MTMTEQDLEPNPYDFIERLDPEKPGKFRSTHSEATGVFVCEELTVRDKSNIETLQAAISGGAMTEKAEALAKWQALATLGFEQSPDGFDVEQLRSEALLHALYLELQAHANFFREAPISGAFRFDPQDTL